MRFVRSDRGSAALLLAAAVLALVLAASPAGPALIAVRDAELPLAATGLHLSVGHLISDGLLAVFFLLIAIELRHELTRGSLASPATAAVPAIAALGGVFAPAAVYLLIAGRAAPGGWPVPTATDIAFALGLLALVGRGLPGRVRAFLLGLAVLDDLVAILLIAIVFPVELEPLWLVPAAVLLGGFALVARRRPRILRTPLLILLGIAAWYCVARSGVHATLAGVALGLLLPPAVAGRVDRVLQPLSRGLILPLFAFSASLIRLEDVSPAALGPVFVGVAVALPVGKLLGITAGGLVATAVLARRDPDRLRPSELLAVALVGGIGFTVSLLMGGLAFTDAEDRTAAVLGVLVGSLAAGVLAALVVPWIAAAHRRRATRTSS